uniref:tyrosine-type recombinase/integrase n=1 Tax=Vallitalea pronyensis TaxID=1348613 RepID=UPI002ED404DB
MSKQTQSLDMTFSSLIELYYEDIQSRLRQSTIENKKVMINLKILPYFKELPLSSITPAHIRKWQNKLLKEDYADTYLRSINNQLVAIFNFAVRYYNLAENPCHKAGTIGKKNASEMQFWTREEYNLFIPSVQDKSLSCIAFKVLYWTGIRIGELMALMPQDIDFDNKQLSINKLISTN